MKKLAGLIFSLSLFISCNNKKEKGSFTIAGDVKNYNAKRAFLEQLYFDSKDPQLLDSATITNGKLSLTGNATEDGLYWLRMEGHNRGFLFINDQPNISFTADSLNAPSQGPVFNSPANSSLKNFILQHDSFKTMVSDQYTALAQLEQAGAQPTDSNFIAANTGFNAAKEKLATFCFKYADTAKTAMVSLFALTQAPVEMEKLLLPLEKLSKRFTDHSGIKAVMEYANQKIAEVKQQKDQQELMKEQQEKQQANQPKIGDMAPEIVMADPEGKPFSLSSLRGKYVLVDFWASWCGPCRQENPNVVAAYKKFSSKNFTILGVSLDQDKQQWLAAIQKDQLSWKQVSDLAYWNSAAVGLYGISGIPYNVLVDPQGKIIATSLRAEGLHRKLEEVLK